MRITDVYLEERPFVSQLVSFGKIEDVRLAEVHLLVGENGSGKTRFLCTLAAAIGNSGDLNRRGRLGKFAVAAKHSTYVFYSDGQRHDQYSIADPMPSAYDFAHNKGPGKPMVNIKGIFNSTVATLAFRGGIRASTSVVAAFKELPETDWSQQLSFDRETNAENDLLGQSLVNLKVQAGMHLASPDANLPNRFVAISQQLENTIARVIGKSFSFMVTVHPKTKLIAVVDGIPMDFDALPDGLRAIVGWLGACVIKLSRFYVDSVSPLREYSVLLIDEPETHLHPAWQRRLVPALQFMLPRSQLFIATHSPFIISSVNEGYIYVFRHSVDGVRITKPQPCSQGDTWLDAVEDILGVKEWYDPETEALLTEFRTARDELRANFSEQRFDAIVALSAKIAIRSESLSVMMGKEINQLTKQLALKQGE